MRLFLLTLASTILALPTEDVSPRTVSFENIPTPGANIESRGGAASGILVNYYNDNVCTQYQLQLKPAMYEWYGYQWGSTQSANIVGCPVQGPGGLCHCVLCDGPNGSGTCAQIYVNKNLQPSKPGGPNCAYGLAIKSMYCEYK
jgi:hypothetical protein